MLASLGVQVIRDGTRLDVVTEGRKLRTATPTALLDDTSRIEPVNGAFASLREFVRDGTKRLVAAEHRDRRRRLGGASRRVPVGRDRLRPRHADARLPRRASAPLRASRASPARPSSPSARSPTCSASSGGCDREPDSTHRRHRPRRAVGAVAARHRRLRDELRRPQLPRRGRRGHRHRHARRRRRLAAAPRRADHRAPRASPPTSCSARRSRCPSSALFGVLPSLASLTGLALGAVYGWADIVTIGTPVEAPYYIAAVPYFAAWVVSLVGAMLVIRWLPRTAHRAALERAAHRPGAALPLGHPARHRRGVPRRGARRRVRDDRARVARLASRRRRRGERRRREAPAGAEAARIGRRRGGRRRARRDRRASPSRPSHPSASCCATRSCRRSTRWSSRARSPGSATTRRTSPRSRCSPRPASNPATRCGSPTMDSYTGRLWNVAGPGASAADGGYAIVGETLPAPELATLGSSRDVEITVEGYDDVWLPTVGYGSSLQLLDDDSAERAGDLRYNAAAGTAVLTSGLGERCAATASRRGSSTSPTPSSSSTPRSPRSTSRRSRTCPTSSRRRPRSTRATRRARSSSCATSSGR